MCVLEDAATSLDWTPEGHTFSNTVAVGENTGTVNKSQALSLLFKYSKSTSSADQLHQVQQQAHFVQSEPGTVVDNSSDEHELGDLLLVNNPIASLVSCVKIIYFFVLAKSSAYISLQKPLIIYGLMFFMRTLFTSHTRSMPSCAYCYDSCKPAMYDLYTRCFLGSKRSVSQW